MWSRVAEKLADFIIASGVTAATMFVLAIGASLTALGFALKQGLDGWHAIRAARRARVAEAAVSVRPGPDDPTLKMPSEPGGGHGQGIVVVDSPSFADDRREQRRREADRSIATALEVAINASGDAMDAKQVAADAARRTEDLERKFVESAAKLDKAGERLANLEGKIDQLPATLAQMLEQRLATELTKAATAAATVLEKQLLVIVAGKVAEEFARREAMPSTGGGNPT